MAAPISRDSNEIFFDYYTTLVAGTFTATQVRMLISKAAPQTDSCNAARTKNAIELGTNASLRIPLRGVMLFVVTCARG